MNARDYYQKTLARNCARDKSRSSVSCQEDGVDWMVSCVESLPRLSGSLLDIGCQTGDLLERVSGYFKTSCGVDIGDYSEYWQRAEHVEFLTHDIDSRPLPFPDDHFDVVTCFMVLEHVFDVFGLVKDISRLTKQGGYAVIEVPNAGYIKHILTLLRGRVPRTGEHKFPFEESEGWDSQHLHYFTLAELISLCNQFNLGTIAHSTRGKYKRIRRIWPSLLYASNALILQKNA